MGVRATSSSVIVAVLIVEGANSWTCFSISAGRAVVEIDGLQDIGGDARATSIFILTWVGCPGWSGILGVCHDHQEGIANHIQRD